MYVVLNRKNPHVFNENFMNKKEKQTMEASYYDKADSMDEVLSLLSEKSKSKFYYNLIQRSYCDIRQILESLYEEKIQRMIIDYIETNNHYNIVPKIDAEQKEKLDFITEENTYYVTTDGPVRPLDYESLYDFLMDVSIEKEGEKQKVIFETLISEMEFSDEEISKTIKEISLFIGERVSSAEKEFYEYFLRTACFKEMFLKNIPFIIKEIITGKFSNYKETNFFEYYNQACEKYGISPKNIEYAKEHNEYFQQVIFDAISGLAYSRKNKENPPNKKNVKRLNAKNNREFRSFIQEKLPKSNKAINIYLDPIRKCLIKALIYRKYYIKDNSMECEDITKDMLMEIARAEAIRYETQEICVNLTDIVNIPACAEGILWNGLDYVMAYTYVEEETKKSIVELIPASPELEYPEAREIKRHFILHYGPTNSGKTYQAIEALKNAKSGVYLGPLRLLALEIQDNLLQDKVPCSLLTGEEENLIEGAMHMASTVEKLDPTKRYEICVIDEAQMIDDPERGFAWTRAILGVQADTIHICMAPEAMNIVKKLINLCGDTYEEVEHKRRSKLVLNNSQFNLNAKNVEEGDAYIVFSKKKVLQVAADLVKQGVKVSMIYGNLPYQVRKEQVRRFINGDTDVVISTNAIGMGINLPVRRIVFLEDRKFNGFTIAPLTITDVKQIAGRAGRNKETGYVSTILDNANEIGEMLNKDTPEIKEAYLGFSDVIISIDAPLPDILRVWRSIEPPDMFKRMDIDRYIQLDEAIFVNVTKKQKLKMISIPFDERNQNLLAQWKGYCVDFENGATSLERPVCRGTTLQPLEEYCQALDLWYSFCKNFGYPMDLEWLRKEKDETSEKINNILIKDAGTFQKRCEECGRPMHWTNPYKTCKKCHDRNRYMW